MALERVPFITSDIKESPKFTKIFSLEKQPETAVLQITGLGLYQAFINGKKAGDAYLTPGFNDYDGYLRYQELDVASLLTSGENRIEVYLGNGWYKGRFGLMPGDRIWGEEYLLAAKLQVCMADGGECRICTDDSWTARKSCIRSNSIYDGEVRDDTFGAPEDMAIVEGAAAVGDAVSCRITDKTFHLIPEICPPVRAKMELKPELIISPKGEKILDFGQNMAGIVRIHSRLKKGNKIHLTFGEILIDECFCNSNYRSANGGFTYISDGTERDVEPMFTYFGFRYALVESEEEIRAEDVTGVVLYTDLPGTMTVHTSNDKLNRLLENSLWGQRGNFLDVPTDCPQRDERLGWTGDAQVFADTACFHMNCEDFYKKFLRDLRYDQVTYLQGDVAMFSPCLKDGAPGGPAWADAATIIPWTMYEHYGNRENLEEAYPLMRDYLEVLIGKDQAEGGTHILKQGHCFGDWLALDGASPNAFKGGTDDVYVRTVYYWYSTELTAKAAAVLEREEDHKRYQALAEEIKSAIRQEFFSPNGRLCIDTQTGYILAIHFGLYPDRDKILEGFRQRLCRDKLRLKTGFVGTGFLLQTLFEAGMDDDAYRMLLTEDFPGWLYAVNLGATTIWERWNSVMPDGTLSPTGMNSLNHYSYGAVASAVYSCIAGLQSAAPGWKKARICPHPNYRLQEIGLAFDSPAGTWESGWKILEDGKLKVRVTVPEGACAHLVLPYHPESEEPELKTGTYEYTYVPTVDFLHPYSGETYIQDIVADENAVRALTEAVPGAFDEVLATVENNAASNLAGAIFFTPIPDLPKKIDEILRKVEYRRS
ncbi:MAG: family 78 glycoside hydrolase catalytic domain [Parasporobacterium sp.]|nr:family 78 glycoside hydrolase catalytic domain [Parasporobacterium sp.]